MVDPLKPTGYVQNITSIQKTTKSADQNARKAESGVPVDQVSLSEDALNMVEAEGVALRTGNILSKDENQTLSSDSNRLNGFV